MLRAIALLCASAFLAAASDVTGDWTLTASLPGGRTQTADLSFARAGGKLTGTISQAGNSMPVQDLKEDGADLSFQVQDAQALFSIHLTLAGDTLSGSLAAPGGISGACTAARKADNALLAEFLTRNSQPLDLTDGAARFSADLIDVSGKQIFLLGEAHGLAINCDLDLALLRYLHKTAGVRVYLTEWGYAAGRLMTRYLETGDQRLLDFMMRETRGSISWTKEHRRFLIKLREWNLTLPERDRIRIVGVDIEHQTQIAAWYLHELAAAAPPPPAPIRDIAVPLRSMDAETATGPAIQQLSDALSASLNSHREDYASWLGDRLLEFDVVVTNLRKRYEAYADREKQFDAIRESAMYETFLKLQPLLGGAKCYGRWGAAHVAQRPYENRDPFASRLNAPGSPVAGKIATIWPLHLNGEALTMTGRSYHSRLLSDESILMKPLSDAARSQVTLFKLSGQGSPFSKALYHFTGPGITTDYAQYLVLIKDAKPTHALDESTQAPRPYVVKTEPPAESSDVAPGVIEIKITFSEPMSTKGFSFVRSIAGQALPFTGEPVLDPDGRTFIIKAKVEPGKIYATWLNTARFQGFNSAAGQPALPYLLVFRTSDH